MFHLKKKQKHHISPFAWVGAFIAFIISIFLVEVNVSNFQASVIPTRTAPVFDGMVAPVQKSPNWMALKSSERKMNFNELKQRGKLISLPKYNPSHLKIPTSSLKWGNQADDAIRNEKITFSVPYMGNYLLDGREYAGNHLAVDIKIPYGTPIHAIGNGVVTKTSEQLYGFGKHIVIEHKNFPSFNNPSQKTTYFSNYCHLSDIVVHKGDIVRKGDLIGHSGNTGTSTTPHIHFQIDNTLAPWHPFWPFTSKEASNAGLTFTQAVNAGLNKDIAIRNTINPILYIQKYASSTTSTLPTEPEQKQKEEEDTTPRKANTPQVTTVPSKRITTPPQVKHSTHTETTTSILETGDPTDGFVTFQIDSQSTFKENKDFTVKIKAVTRTGKLITNYVPKSPVRVEKIRGKAVITPTRLSSKNFVNGIATLTISPKDTSPIQFKIHTDSVIKESPVIAQGLFLDVSEVHPHFRAISFLKDEGIIQGYPDGSFKPKNSVSRVEVMKFILEGLDAKLAPSKELPFRDTANNTWYSDYLQTGIYLKIIKGYKDGTFKPTNTVNKVEFLKMLISAMNVDINPKIGHLPFTDVDKDAWYAKYVQFAYRKNLIDSDSKTFNPQEKMTRENVAEAIYRVQILKQTGASTFSNNAG